MCKIATSVHFDISSGSTGNLTITSEFPDNLESAVLHLDSRVNTDSADYSIRYQIIDGYGNIAAEAWRPATDPKTDILLPKPHLWQGADDPYLYRCSAALLYRDEFIDQVSTTFGVRDFHFDSKKGAFLNGRQITLRGVSFNRDRFQDACSLTTEQYLQYAQLISEMGANTVCLAQYQYNDDFYDICDKFGFIVWVKDACINCQSDSLSNHPSICFGEDFSDISPADAEMHEITDTENRQAEYHERIAKLLTEHPNLWSSYISDMFDSEHNNKGLVTMDRQLRKDAFFIYKAYWSDKPFVHLCEKQYAQRERAFTDIKVYSNQPQVSLHVNGILFSTQTESRIFIFKDVPLNKGFNYISAISGDCMDTTTLECTDSQSDTNAYTNSVKKSENKSEHMVNWFDCIETVASDAPIEFSASHFSVQDKVKDIMEHDDAYRILSGALSSMSNMTLTKSMLSSMQDKTLAELAATLTSKGNGSAPENALQIINSELNKIPKHH